MKTAPKSERMLAAPLAPLILRTALPSMGAMLASGVCALADALLLRRLGQDAAAAVSLSFPLLSLIQTIGFTLGTGGGNFVSRSLGAGDKESALRAASTAFFGALVVSCALCALGFLFAFPLVRLLGAQAAQTAAGAAYARCVLAAGPMLCANLVLGSLVRGQGNTLAGLYAFGSGALLGLALQVLFILCLGMGIVGSGAAMIARETLTLVLLIAFSRREPVRPRLFLFSLRPVLLRGIMRSGFPAMLRQGLFALSSALMTRAASAAGPAVLSGMGLSVRVLSLISSGVIGFGQGFAPVCGYAYGSGRMDRVLGAYRFALRAVVLSLLALGAALFFLSEPLLARLGGEPEALLFAAAFLRAQSVTLFAQGAVIVMTMLTQAMGLPLPSCVVSASRQGFVLIPLVLIMPSLFSVSGLILSQSVSDLLSLALCFFVTRAALRGSSCARGGCSDARTASR